MVASANNGHEAVVQLLLDKGADIEAEDNVSLTGNYSETIILDSIYYLPSSWYKLCNALMITEH